MGKDYFLLLETVCNFKKTIIFCSTASGVAEFGAGGGSLRGLRGPPGRGVQPLGAPEQAGPRPRHVAGGGHLSALWGRHHSRRLHVPPVRIHPLLHPVRHLHVLHHSLLHGLLPRAVRHHHGRDRPPERVRLPEAALQEDRSNVLQKEGLSCRSISEDDVKRPVPPNSFSHMLS